MSDDVRTACWGCTPAAERMEARELLTSIMDTVSTHESVPASSVFMALQWRGVSYPTYRRALDTLVTAGIVEVHGPDLVWTGG